MFGDFFNNITDYAKSRFTNPFLGTLLVVWAIRNFEFLFALFNFAEGVTLTQKIDYIHRYFEVHGIWDQVCNALIALLLLIVGFVLQWVSRALTNIYSRAIDLLNEKTDKGSVISREQYDKLRNQLITIKSERDELRSAATSHDVELRDLNILITKLAAEKNSAEVDLASCNLKVSEAKDEIGKLKLKLPPTNNDNGSTQIVNVDDFILRHGLTLENIPIWISNITSRGLLKEKLGRYANSSSFKTYTKSQRDGIIKIEKEGLLLDFLYYVNYLKESKNGEHFVELEKIKVYLRHGLFYTLEITDEEIIEERVRNIVVTSEANEYFDYMTDDLLPF